jgi:hypothetical protein
MIFVMIVHRGGKTNLLPVLVSPSADDVYALNKARSVSDVRYRVKREGESRGVGLGSCLLRFSHSAG